MRPNLARLELETLLLPYTDPRMIEFELHVDFLDEK